MRRVSAKRTSIIGHALLQLTLLSILFAYTYFREFYDISPVVFWALLGTMISNACVALLRSKSYEVQILILAILSLGVVFVRAPPSFWPFQINGIDDYFEIQLSRTILEQGRWDPTQGLGFAANYYGYFPGLHLLLSQLGLVLGSDLFMIAKYVMLPTLLLEVVLLGFLIIRLCSKELFDQGLLGIAGLVYVSTIGVLGLFISRRAYAIVFLLVICFLYARRIITGANRSFVALLSILVFGLAIGDHATEDFLLALMAISIIFLRRRKLPLGSPVRSVMMMVAIVFAWQIFLAPFVFQSDLLGYFSQLLSLFTGGQYESAQNLVGYSFLEGVVPYLSQSLLILSAIVGFLVMGRHPGFKMLSERTLGIFQFFTVSGLATYLVMGPLIFVSSLKVLTFLTSPFSGIAMSVLSTVGVIWVLKLGRRWCYSSSPIAKLGDALKVFRVRPRTLIMMVFVLLVFPGNLLISFSARFVDRGPFGVTVIEDPRNIKQEFVSAGLFLQQNTKQPASVAGDTIVWLVFGGYLSIDTSNRLLSFVNESSFHNLASEFRIVVVDANLARYSSDANPGLFPSKIANSDFTGLNRVYSNDLVTFVSSASFGWQM